MTGKACIAVTKYYDRKQRRISFKQRPVLVVGHSDLTDYVALPISRVTLSRYIDPDYDYPLEVQTFPAMSLTQKSYIRTHKQFVVSSVEITKIICDFRAIYPNAYVEVLELVEQFQKRLLEAAL